MASSFNINAYCRNQPELRLFPAPIIAKRAPTANDINFPIGQLWVEPANTANVAINGAWILTSIIANVANWADITGGAGAFTSLIVTPGPIALTGTTTINIVGAANTNIGTGANTGTVTIGSANSTAVDLVGPVFLNPGGASNTSIGTAGNTGIVTIGNANITVVDIVGPTDINVGTADLTRIGVAGTGAVQIGNATGNTFISAGNLTVSAGAVSATNTGANRAIVGDTTGGTGVTATLSSSGATVDALQLAGGGILVVPVTPAAGASPRVASGRFGSAAFTDIIGAGATVALTVTNTMSLATSVVIASVSCATVGSACVIRDVDVSTPGSIVFNVTNLGANPTALNILINFWLLS